MQVLVRDNNIDQALKALKRKMQREGTFREMKLRRFYEKPSEKATREKAESERRRRKRARKQAVLDGLIPAPKKTIGQTIGADARDFVASHALPRQLPGHSMEVVTCSELAQTQRIPRCVP